MTNTHKPSTIKKNLWLTLPLLLLILVCVFFIFQMQKEESTNPTHQSTQDNIINRAVPNFNLPMLEDPQVTLTNTSLPQQAFLLNFWGSWCLACSKEHPQLIKIAEQGVNIVGVNYQDDAEYALQYLADNGDPYSINLQDAEGDLAIDFALIGAPETFVIDADGIVRQHIIGQINNKEWKQRIQPCLSLLQQGSTGIDTQKLSQACQ